MKEKNDGQKISVLCKDLMECSAVYTFVAFFSFATLAISVCDIALGKYTYTAQYTTHTMITFTVLILQLVLSLFLQRRCKNMLRKVNEALGTDFRVAHLSPISFGTALVLWVVVGLIDFYSAVVTCLCISFSLFLSVTILFFMSCFSEVKRYVRNQ